MGVKKDPEALLVRIDCYHLCVVDAVVIYLSIQIFNATLESHHRTTQDTAYLGSELRPCPLRRSHDAMGKRGK